MPHLACSPPLDGPAKTKDYLAHYCFEAPKPLKLLGPWLLTAAAILAVIGVAVWVEAKDDPLLSAASPLATMGLLIAGLSQWRGARQEISMDKYYERLNISNQWWKSSPSVQKAMAGFARDSEDPDMTMYVCLEIDNLEYVIEKYRIGHVDDEQACRGLRAFQVRCLSSPEFRAIARRRVHIGDYTPRAASVVCKVCDEVDNLIEHHRASEFASGSCPSSQMHLHIAAAAAIQVTPTYPPPPPPVEEAMGHTPSSVLQFGRRATDRTAGAAACSGGEAASAVGASLMQAASQPGRDTETPPPAGARGVEPDSTAAGRTR